MQILKKYFLEIIVFTLLLVIKTPAFAQKVADEYQIKAVFLFNFAQFLEWPTNAFASPEAPIVIGIVGKDPFGSALKETVKGELIGGRQLIIKNFAPGEEIDFCHILFVHRLDQSKVKDLLEQIKDKNTLTVSDDKNFIASGGMINFITANNKIKFQINPDRARANGISISSKVLKLAEIVVPEK
jgi:hypothetical protein